MCKHSTCFHFPKDIENYGFFESPHGQESIECWVASKSWQKEFSPIWLQCSHSVFAHNKYSSDTSLEKTKRLNELIFGQFDILKSFPLRTYLRDFYRGMHCLFQFSKRKSVVCKMGYDGYNSLYNWLWSEYNVIISGNWIAYQSFIFSPIMTNVNQVLLWVLLMVINSQMLVHSVKFLVGSIQKFGGCFQNHYVRDLNSEAKT